MTPGAIANQLRRIAGVIGPFGQTAAQAEATRESLRRLADAVEAPAVAELPTLHPFRPAADVGPRTLPDTVRFVADGQGVREAREGGRIG